MISDIRNKLCKYKNAFGSIKKGIHSYRVFDIAILDFGVTFLVAWLLAYVFHWNVWWSFLGLFLAGIIAHRMFCVRTTIDKWLFSDSFLQ